MWNEESTSMVFIIVRSCSIALEPKGPVSAAFGRTLQHRRSKHEVCAVSPVV